MDLGNPGEVLIQMGIYSHRHFQHRKLEKKHLAARKKYNLDWDFNEYKPHVTLSYEGDNDLEGL